MAGPRAERAVAAARARAAAVTRRAAIHTAAPWLGLAGATVLAGWALERLGLPSSYLFAALLVSVAVALARPGRLTLPAPAFLAAQAVTGVTIGAYLRSGALTAVAHDWLPVMLVSAATLIASLAVGAALARTTALDTPTAALGTIAGGASGIVTMARELGGDDRLVAFMQYARVLIVVLATPLLAALLFGGHSAAHAGATSGPLLGGARGWLVTLGAAPAGVLAGRLARLPAGTLLGPMVVSAILTLAAPFGEFSVPPLLREAAFAAIGLQIGLGFTVATLRTVGRLLVPVLLGVAVLIAACFGLAALLQARTSVSLLDAYLATTPGGLFAVLPLAFGSGANATFVVAVQGVRVLVMVLLAPFAVRVLIGLSSRERPA